MNKIDEKDLSEDEHVHWLVALLLLWINSKIHLNDCIAAFISSSANYIFSSINTERSLCKSNNYVVLIIYFAAAIIVNITETTTWIWSELLSTHTKFTNEYSKTVWIGRRR